MEASVSKAAIVAAENALVDPGAPRVGRSTRRHRHSVRSVASARGRAAGPPSIRNALRCQRKNAVRPPKLAIVRALIAMGEAEQKATGKHFVIDGLKLKRFGVSPKWYVAKYDPSKGYDDKVSLDTEDEQEAKTMVALLAADDTGEAFRDKPDLELDVVVELYLLRPGKGDSWSSHSGSVLRGIEAALPGIKVGAFTLGAQKTLIKALAAGAAGRRMGPGTVSNCMILIKSAINWARRPDDDDRILCEVPERFILNTKKDVAGVMRVDAPGDRNDHATLEETAAFLKLIQNHEAQRRWMLLVLGFVCRADAAASATAEQIDLRKGVYHLNPKGRPQNYNKYRPSLPIPPSLLAEISCWGDGPWIDESADDLRKPFKAAGAILGLGPDFIPSSVRDFGATMLREAYVRYGVPFVPDEQVKMWMGHRERSINHGYGKFGPSYLLLARNAIECVLHELDELSGGVLFRNARAAGTLPAGPVVIDPAELRGSGMRKRSGNSGNSQAPAEGEEGDKITVGAIPTQRHESVRPWGRAVMIGSSRAKTGGIGSLQGNFWQVQESPAWAKEAPDSITARLIEQGFRIVEFRPDGDESGQTQLFVIGKAAKLMSDGDTQRVCNSAWVRWTKGRRANEAGAQSPMGMMIDGECTEVAPLVEITRVPALPPARRKPASKRP
ncbi:hypothetical protein [Methylobacterium sp. NFXW15]|uniref:hypothetical protein n=1 Tax=Methylobacterium sp. NFXW15 TaxID=2819512 RepID=UPI003CFA006D